MLHSLAPRIAPLVPRWGIRKLERLLHVDQIKDFMEEYFNDKPLESASRRVEYCELSTKVVQKNNLAIVSSERPIIVANQPLGGPESLVLMDVLKQSTDNLSMVVKRIIGEVRPLEPLLVQMLARRDQMSSQVFRDVFAGDEPIIIFPAGYCSRPLSNGTLFDYAWHSTFVKMARRHRRPLLPIHISGFNSKRFYRLSALRRAVGLKVSLESILLPEEMYRQQGNTIRLVVGQAVGHKVFRHDTCDSVWADRVRNHVYRLKEDPSTVFDPASPAVLPLT